MEITITRSDRLTEVSLAGELTLAESSGFRETVSREMTASSSPAALLLDLTDLHYLDSSGLGALLAVFNLARQQDFVLGLCHLQPKIVDILKITNLADVLPLFTSREKFLATIA